MKAITFILTFLIVTNLNSQNKKDFEVSSFGINIYKIGPNTINEINAVTNKEKLEVGISPNCSQEDLANICKLSWITKLKIGTTMSPTISINDIKCVASLKKLTHFNIYSGVKTPIDVTIFSKLNQLEHLCIINNKVINTKSLASLTKLNYLVFGDAGIKSIEFLLKMPLLEKLEIEGPSNAISSFSCLGSLQKLKILSLEESPTASNENLVSLLNSNKLEEINLSLCKKIQTLDFLNSHKELVEVNASESGLLNIDGLKNAKKMEELSIDETQVSVLTALSGNESIKKLSIGKLMIADVSPLFTCSALRTLKVSEGINESKRKELEAKLPELEISDYN